MAVKSGWSPARTARTVSGPRARLAPRRGGGYSTRPQWSRCAGSASAGEGIGGRQGARGLRWRRRVGRGIVPRQWRRAPRGVGKEAVDPRASRNRSGMIRTPRTHAPDVHRDQGRRADQRLGRRSSARLTPSAPACWPTRTRTLTVPGGGQRGDGIPFSRHRGRGGPLPFGQSWHLRQDGLHAARLVATPMLPARRTAGHRAVDR